MQCQISHFWTAHKLDRIAFLRQRHMKPKNNKSRTKMHIKINALKWEKKQSKEVTYFNTKDVSC